MKVLALLFASLFLWMACDEVGDILEEEYKEPEIQDLILSGNNVQVGDTVKAVVLATNPEKGPLFYSWSAPDGGQFIQPATSDTAFWIAPFAGDTYRIKAKVENEQKSNSIERPVTVISPEKPLVNITSPSENQIFVQGVEIIVNVSAFHDNTLSSVKLFVNDVMTGSPQNYDPSNIYSFKINTNENLVGEIVIRVTAEAAGQAGNIGSDTITVFIAGILPKTGGN